MADEAPTFAPDSAIEPLAPSFAPDSKVEPLNAPIGLGEMASQAAQNLGPSYMKFGKDLYHAVTNPAETASGVKDLGLSLLAKGHQAGFLPEVPQFGFGATANDERTKTADALGQHLADRYGGYENIKRSIAEDPIGVLADASIPFTGGETLAARVPGTAARIAERALHTAATVSNPIQHAGLLAKAGTQGLKGLSAVESGVGAPALEQAYASGLAGGNSQRAFRENITGRAPLEDVVQEARDGLARMRAERGAQYREEMGKLHTSESQFGEADRVLDFGKIDNAIEKAEKVQTFSGRSGTGPTQHLNPAAQAVRDEMIGHVEQWKGLPAADYHTAEGLDALKRQLWNDMRNTPPGSPARTAAQGIYNAVKNTVAEYYPHYTKIMGEYQRASQELDELTRALSLGEKATVDTSLKKLQSILRDNVSTSFAHRARLATRLENAGDVNLRSALAGQALHPIMPRGLGKLAMQHAIPAIASMAGMGASGGLGGAGALAATLPFMMPRVVGEVANRSGVARRYINPALPAIDKGALLARDAAPPNNPFTPI